MKGGAGRGVEGGEGKGGEGKGQQETGKVSITKWITFQLS